MKFTDLNLNKPLFKALDDLGFVEATPIQEKVFPIVMSGADVVGIAQTGTGKTLGFLLPLLRLWKFSKEPHPQILILVPPRELVQQVVGVVEELTTNMNLVVGGAYGGTNIKTQMAMCIRGLDVLVATPGRLIDLALKGALKLNNIRKLVIDEVDEMMNLGFRHQLVRVFDLLPSRRQNLLFSATMTEDVESLFEDFFNRPVKIEAAPSGTPLENINQRALSIVNFLSKINFLELLLQDKSTYTKTLIFTSTKKRADILFEKLDEFFPDETVVIHSNKTQNTRFAALDKFKSGDCRLLIATDLVARGIDVSDVSHVINIDTPDNPENYIHRIGRTGRADKKGNSLLLYSEKEQPFLDAIETLMTYEIPKLPTPEALVITDELIEDEKPNYKMKNLQVRIDIGEEDKAFHEKKDKNKKENKPLRRAERMKLKYKKPKTRGDKRRKKK